MSDVVDIARLEFKVKVFDFADKYCSQSGMTCDWDEIQFHGMHSLDVRDWFAEILVRLKGKVYRFGVTIGDEIDSIETELAIVDHTIEGFHNADTDGISYVIFNTISEQFAKQMCAGTPFAELN